MSGSYTRRPEPPLQIPGADQEVLLGGQKISRTDLFVHLWEQGLLHFLFREHQKPLFMAQAAMKPGDTLVEVCSRRFGKTTEKLILAEIIARTQPGAIIRYAAPTETMAKTIVLPAWRKLLKTCPKHLQAADKTLQERCWMWPNGSRLYLAGTDLDPDRLRGPESHLVIVDEAGSHKKLRYVVDDVLMPQVLDSDGIMIIPSTPPESMDHEFLEYWRAAKSEGKLVVRTLHDNTFYSREKKLSICKKVNKGYSTEEILAIFEGRMEGTPTWEREYMCRMVTDKSRRVCPDFDERQHVGSIGSRMAAYETHYVFIDQSDAQDPFGAVFATYNFALRKLFVQAEWTDRSNKVKRKNSSQIATELKKIELELWGPMAPVKRFSDDPRGGSQRRDMAEMYKYPIQTAKKSTGRRDSMDTLSVFIKGGQIVVDPRCGLLLDQLRDGLWHATKADFERTNTMGHLDLLDALGMGVRCVAWSKNPAPVGYQNSDVMFYATEPEKAVSKGFEQTLRNLGSAFNLN